MVCGKILPEENELTLPYSLGAPFIIHYWDPTSALTEKLGHRLGQLQFFFFFELSGVNLYFYYFLKGGGERAINKKDSIISIIVNGFRSDNNYYIPKN